MIYRIINTHDNAIIFECHYLYETRYKAEELASKMPTEELLNLVIMEEERQIGQFQLVPQLLIDSR